jgi:hypothetical protein
LGLPPIESDSIKPSPMPYGVINIAEGETLTAREGHGTNTPVLFEIPRDAANIFPVPAYSDYWIRVKYEGQIGNVPMHNLAIGKAGNLQFPGTFRCKSYDSVWEVVANPAVTLASGLDHVLLVFIEAHQVSADAMEVKAVAPLENFKATLFLKTKAEGTFSLRTTIPSRKLGRSTELNAECRGRGELQTEAK